MANKRKAFTLAEVLITLGIIGIVAAMTIPTLTKNIQEKQTITQVKAVYSILSQAYSRVLEENGTPDSWITENVITANDYHNTILERIEPYLKVAKTCPAGSDGSSCFAGLDYKTIKNEAWKNLDNTNDGASIILQNGIILRFQAKNTSFYCKSDWGSSVSLKNACGFVMADLNGHKKPNVVGKDTFFFAYTKYGIAPLGGSGIDNVQYSFSNCCLGSGRCRLGPFGIGCSTWITENNNMDYLHCPNELSWDGKHSCK